MKNLREQVFRYGDLGHLECDIVRVTDNLRAGDMPGKERAANDEAFRASALDCLVCSPKVADAGFNWQFCGSREVGHIIYASLDYLSTTFTQSYRRCTRQVRSTPLRISVMVYLKSLDWRVIDIVSTAE